MGDFNVFCRLVWARDLLKSIKSRAKGEDVRVIFFGH